MAHAHTVEIHHWFKMKFIPYGRQDISDRDIEAVVKTLRSDWLTQGPAVSHFENTAAKYVGAKYAVAVCNATAALHIACLAYDIGPGDIVWTSPNTFVASANCALYCGATVDFVDIDPLSYNVSIQALSEKLEKAKQKNALPKLFIPVHFAGQPSDMKEIYSLAKQYGFGVLEDASHAVGGSYRDKKIGSCEYSDMTVFSFHPVKIFTTGEGGMVLTNNEKLYHKLMRLRSHGITRDPALMTEKTHGDWYYQQIDLGFNYRITDMQAVLGTSQIERLDSFVERRRAIAARYDEELANMPLILPHQHKNTHSPYHLYVIQVQSDAKKNRKEVFDAMRSVEIGVNVHYIPVYLQPYYKKLGFETGYCPQAEKYYANAMSIPMYSALSNEDQSRVISAIKKIF